MIAGIGIGIGIEEVCNGSCKRLEDRERRKRANRLASSVRKTHEGNFPYEILKQIGFDSILIGLDSDISISSPSNIGLVGFRLNGFSDQILKTDLDFPNGIWIGYKFNPFH